MKVDAVQALLRTDDPEHAAETQSSTLTAVATAPGTEDVQGYAVYDWGIFGIIVIPDPVSTWCSRRFNSCDGGLKGGR